MQKKCWKDVATLKNHTKSVKITSMIVVRLIEKDTKFIGFFTTQAETPDTNV